MTKTARMALSLVALVICVVVTDGRPLARAAQGWSQSNASIDFSRQVAVQVQLEVVSSNDVPTIASGTRERYYLAIQDKNGQAYTIGLAGNGFNINSIAVPGQPLRPFPIAGAFHTFRVEVIDNRATFRIDGALVGSNIAPTNATILDGPGVGFGGLAADSRSMTPLKSFCVGTNVSACSARGVYAYVTDAGSDSVRAYTIDAVTGALAATAGSPFAAGTQPASITVDPTRRFAYVANSACQSGCNSPSSISAYAIDGRTGALTSVPGSPFATGAGPLTVTVEPSGRFAYAANYHSHDIWAYTIDATTGALAGNVPGSPFPTAGGPTRITVDPSGRFVYVSSDANDVSAYALDAGTGTLTPVPGSPFPAGTDAKSVTVDPSGRFAYVANAGASNVSAYAIDAATGALAPLPGSPFAAGLAQDVAVDPSGHFVYVPNGSSNTISAYAIDPNTGALTAVPGSPFATGDYPYFVAIDPLGLFAYVAHYYSGNVSAYAITPGTGALTPVSGSPFAAGPYAASIVTTAGPAINNVGTTIDLAGPAATAIGGSFTFDDAPHAAVAAVSAGVTPELPRVYVDTTYALPVGGTLRIANTASQFQAALNSAQLGDVIELRAGTIYQGPFTLPNKSGTGWIYVRSSADASLPAPGNRVSPASATFMPTLVAGSGSSAIIATNGAHHFRFVGIEARPPANTFINNLISLGSGSESSVALQPHHIIFDRSYIHGDPTVGGRRGLAFNGVHLAVVDSYVADFKSTQYDSQAVCGWAGQGPFKIANNYLEAAAENVMFGGGDPAISNLTPSDIEVRGNHFFKPLAWKGSTWVVKNLFEFKHGRRVLAEGNILENNFITADQDGTALIWKSANEEGTAPWTVTEDVTFRYNIVRHAAGVLRISAAQGGAPPTSRFLLEHNLFYDISAANWGEGIGLGELLQPFDPTQDLVLRHNTSDGDGQNSIFFSSASLRSGFVFTDNVMPRNAGGVKGAGFAEGTASLNHFAPGYVFTSNALAGANAASYPAGNVFPASMDGVGFVNRAGGNYHLSSTSPYKNAASDGKDLGADMDAVDAATACTISGLCGTIPPSDTMPPTVALTAPADGAAVSGTSTTVSATASDNVGVVGVQFKLDGANLNAEVVTPPYAIVWNTNTATNGSHSLTAVARDAAGNARTSTARTVTVNNVVADTTPPSVPLNLAATAVSASQINLSWTASTDNVGVTGYRVFRAGSQIATPSTTSYSDTGLTASTAYSYTVAAVDAASNVSAQSAPASATTQAVTPTSTVAAYSFNEGVGTTAGDSSASNNTAVLAGATWSALGKYGSALAFNGTSSYVDAPDGNALSPGTAATFEAWVLLSAAPTEIASVINKWSQSADDEYLIGINPNRTLFFAWHTTGSGAYGTPSLFDLSGSTVIPLNTLTHIAIVRSGTSVVSYINGNIDVSLNPMDTNPFRNGTNSLRIGGQARGGVNRYLNGRIDEVRIYARALTQGEVQGDMNTPISVTGDGTAPTVALTAPANNATVSGIATTVSATASDNVGVAGVQFKVDGVNLGAEDTVSPYATSWNTTTAGNGPHTLTATARDAAGNSAISTRTVTVANSLTYFPDSYTIGVGTYIGGNAASLAADDNNWLVVKSTTSGTRRTSTDVAFVNAVPASRLDYSVRLKANTAGTSVIIYAFNYATSTWTQITSGSVGTAEATLTASIAGSAANYISNNAMRVRVESSNTSNYRLLKELITIAVTP